MSSLTLVLVGSLAIGALTFLFIKFISWLASYRQWLAMLRKIPQRPSNLIFGHLFDYPGPNEAGLTYQRNFTATFPRTGLNWLMYTPMIMTNHPETAKVVLKSSEPKGHRIYNLIRPWIGDGLLLSEGAKWARNRRLLTPAFHFEILKNYMEVKNRCADLLVKNFQNLADNSEPLKVFANITMFTLDVILQCSMSYRTNCQLLGEKVHPYVQAVHELSELAAARFFQPWFHGKYPYVFTPSGRRFLKCCKLVHEVSQDIIQSRKKALAEEGGSAKEKKRNRCMDFLDILLTARDEEGNGLTDQEIQDEADTFLFEGHDTTASAISWTLYSLAAYPEVQQKVHEEIDDLMSGRETPDVLWEDLSKLPYLTMVIKESMRVHSPVPFIQRQLTTDTVIDGMTVPKGVLVNILVYNIHHNPTVWKDPLVFDPERFTPENIKERDSYAFVPFSAGPRNCIGQNFAMDEIKIALVRILHKFNLRLDTTHKVERLEIVVMRAEKDIQLYVTNRQE